MPDIGLYEIAVEPERSERYVQDDNLLWLRFQSYEAQIQKRGRGAPWPLYLGRRSTEEVANLYENRIDNRAARLKLALYYFVNISTLDISDPQVLVRRVNNLNALRADIEDEFRDVRKLVERANESGIAEIQKLGRKYSRAIDEEVESARGFGVKLESLLRLSEHAKSDEMTNRGDTGTTTNSLAIEKAEGQNQSTASHQQAIARFWETMIMDSPSPFHELDRQPCIKWFRSTCA